MGDFDSKTQLSKSDHDGESRGTRTFSVRCAVYSVVLAALCAVPVVAFIGTSADSYLATIPYLDIAGGNRRLGGYIFAAVAFVSVAVFSYFAFTRCGRWMDRLDGISMPRLLSASFNRRSILTTAAIIFVCWIPAMIALFPCATTTYDTIDQIYQALSDPPLWYFSTNTVVDASLIDHHPWFDTIIFGAFAWLGRFLGSDTIGLFAYGILQTALSSVILSASICYLEKLHVPGVLRTVALAFIILLPIFPATADTMQKDSLFALVFLVYALMFLEIFRTNGEALGSKRFIIGFACTIALCILTKKLGIYILGLSTIVLFVAVPGKRIRSLTSFAVPAVICMALIPAFLFPLLNIAPGGSQEMLGLMYQQTVTVLKEDPESVTDEQIDVIDRVLDVDKAMASYKGHITDWVKQHARKNASREDLAAYMKLWASMGISHPYLYLKSMARCCAQLMVASKPFVLNTGVSQNGIDYYTEHVAQIGQTFSYDAASPPETQAFSQALYSFYWYTICRIPVLSLICTMGFYDTWIPLFALLATLYSRRRRDACALAPILASALFLFVSPTSLARYALCMAFVALPAIGWAIRCLRLGRQGNEMGDEPTA